MSRAAERPANMVDLNGLVIGHVAGVAPSGRPLVVWPGEGERTREAEVLRHAQPGDWNACAGLRCVLAFPRGEAAPPIVIGLLDPSPGARAGDPATRGRATSAPDHLRIEAGREIVLECGQARISLRADGRIVIQGGYLLSRSTGVQKIKGASVQIN